MFNMITRTIDVLKGAIDKSRIISLHKNFARSHGITSFNFESPRHRMDTLQLSHTEDCISMCTVTLNANVKLTTPFMYISGSQNFGPRVSTGIFIFLAQDTEIRINKQNLI